MAFLSFDHLYDRLLAHYGPQSEPPGNSPLERLISMVLIQRGNTARAAEALGKLRDADSLEPHILLEMDADELDEPLEAAGVGRQAIGRLRKIAKLLIDRYKGDAVAMLAADAETLRAELTAINGIGRSMADAIVLHAGRRPVFVVDRAVHRVFKRHGWFDFEADDQEIQASVEGSLVHDARRLAQFHSLIDRVGRDYCGATPRCEECPLAALLPEAGPCEPPIA